MYKNSERGNAVIFILIAIALFGALAFTFMRGAKTGQGNLTLGQSKNAATEILSYAATMERTIDRLRQKGCSESDISYQLVGNASYNDYAHTPASPSNCNIFDASGGNMAPPDFWENGYIQIDGTPWWTNEAELMYVTVDGVGTTGGDAGKDLVLWVRSVKKPICEEINKQLNSPVSLSYATFIVMVKYNGLFGTATGYLAAGGFGGLASTCYSYDGTDANFYHVLLAR